MRVLVLCGCSSKCKSLSQLNLCQACYRLSCTQCQLFEPVLKYCPLCMEVPSRADQTHCTKNCFQCPRCKLGLVISSESCDDGNKKYVFKCMGCHWDYKTPSVGKIRSLTKYIKSLKANECLQSRRFEVLERHYHSKRQLLDWGLTRTPLKIPLDGSLVADRRNVLQRLSQGDKLFELLDEPCPMPLKDTSDALELPLQMHLRCKYKYICPHCLNTLLKPETQPKSLKFYTTSFAVKYLPALSLAPRSQIDNKVYDDTRFALVISNPTSSEEMCITMSGSDGLFIPITEVRIRAVTPVTPSHQDHGLKMIEQFILSVPTYKLTADTKLSRVERTRRLGNKNLNIYSTANNSSTSLLEDLEDYKLLDQGSGWCIVPVNLLNNASVHSLFITVATQKFKVTMNCVIKK